MRKLFLLLWGVVFFAAQAIAQRTISGKVTNDKGTPLQNGHTPLLFRQMLKHLFFQQLT